MFKILLIISFVSIISAHPAAESNNGTFYYFAYGSNLLAKRIHIKNPTAVFYSAAKLDKHRLDFNIYDEPWAGCAATIVEDDAEHVWGSLWSLDLSQKKYLDEQENVADGLYFAKNVTVTTTEGIQVSAWTYQLTVGPEKTPKDQDLPFERRPSNTYLQVIALGAIESKLPAEYIGFLFSLPTNRRMAPASRRQELGYPF